MNRINVNSTEKSKRACRLLPELASRVPACVSPSVFWTMLVTVVALWIPACGYHENPEPEKTPSPPAPAGTSATEVVARYLALDRSRDSSIKMRVKIISTGAAAELGAPGVVEIALHRKRTPDNGELLLVEFLSPAQERDRDSLVTISAAGEVEGVRYVQSRGAFLTATGVTSEDALFGMTLQEMAGAQPEKYDYKLAGEQRLGEWNTYKLDGTLKPGAESKFPRLVLFIAKDSYAAVGAEFYDNHDELARRMTVEKMEQLAGHWTRMQWTLENPARGKRLEFQTMDARYDQGLSDSIFTREHLKKIATK